MVHTSLTTHITANVGIRASGEEISPACAPRQNSAPLKFSRSGAQGQPCTCSRQTRTTVRTWVNMFTNEFTEGPSSAQWSLASYLLSAELSMPAQDTATVLAAVYSCAVAFHLGRSLFHSKRASMLLLLPAAWEIIAFGLRAKLGECSVERLFDVYLPLRAISTLLLLLAPSWPLFYMFVSIRRLVQLSYPRESAFSALHPKRLGFLLLLSASLALLEAASPTGTRDTRFGFRALVIIGYALVIPCGQAFRAMLRRTRATRRAYRVLIYFVLMTCVLLVLQLVCNYLTLRWDRLSRKEDYVFLALALPLLLALVGVDLVPELAWRRPTTPDQECGSWNEKGDEGRKGTELQVAAREEVVRYGWKYFGLTMNWTEFDAMF